MDLTFPRKCDTTLEIKTTILQIMPITLLHILRTTEVLENLYDLTKKLFSWLANNQMKPKDYKCHMILSFPEAGAALQIETPRCR